MSSVSKDINIIISPRSPVLQAGHELVGILECVQPMPEESGLIWISVSGCERLVAEELDAKLLPLVGRKVSLVRIEEKWSVVGL